MSKLAAFALILPVIGAVPVKADPLLELQISYTVGGVRTTGPVTSSGDLFVGDSGAAPLHRTGVGPFLQYGAFGYDDSSGHNYGTHFGPSWRANEAATITFALTEINLTRPAQLLGLKNSYGGQVAGTTVYSSMYLDNTNQPFGTGYRLDSSSRDFSASPTAQDPRYDGPIVNAITSSEFSITQIFTVVTNMNGSIGSIDSTLVDLPEPASFMLLGFGLLGALGLRRKTPLRNPVLAP